MGMINGKFDTDLSGWILWVPYPYCTNITWDNGRARLYTCDCIFGLGADMLSLSQDFLIDDSIFRFDWAANNFFYARPSYELSILHISWTDDKPIYTWEVIASQTFGALFTDPTSGRVFVDVSKYIGKTAKIKFSIKTGGWYGCLIYRDKIMWVDNVMLVPNWGVFNISSDPAGAEIWIDGSNTGYLTPKTIPEIAPGSHTLVLKKAGYYDYTKTIDVVPGETYDISAKLQMQVGNIIFYTFPAGAKIYLSEKDGTVLKDTGFLTPYTISDLAWGTYKWRMHLDFYRDESGTVTINTPEGEFISKTLVPSGNIIFTTEPPGASITLDGVLQEGLTTPAVIGVAEGSHHYVLSLLDYDPAEGDVYVYLGQTSQVTKTLLLTARGNISFVSVPEGAEIFLDNVDQGTVTPATITDIPSGSHTYALKLSGFNDYTGAVEVITKQAVTVSATLVPAEGCVFFVTNPTGAKIFIDNIDTGQVTPALICGLALGTHTFRLVLAGYQDTSGSIDLTAGQGTVVTVTLASVEIGVGAGLIVGVAAIGLGVVGVVAVAARGKQ